MTFFYFAGSTKEKMDFHVGDVVRLSVAGELFRADRDASDLGLVMLVAGTRGGGLVEVAGADGRRETYYGHHLTRALANL